MSGEELLSISMEEIHDVKSLKTSLRRLYSFPTSMQRLLHNGNNLEDSVGLDASIDISLQLVLLAPCTAKQLFEATEELVEACEIGNLQVAQLLLEAGAHKDAWSQSQSHTGFTCLMLTAKYGHEEIARLLLQAGAARDVHGVGGFTSLMLAAKYGHGEIARLLLEAGASKDNRNINGSTALMLAAMHGHVEITRLLLEAGDDKDTQNIGGLTALMLAAKNGHEEMVRLLVEAGAVKDVKNVVGLSALMLAAESGHCEIVRLLREAGAKDPESATGQDSSREGRSLQLPHCMIWQLPHW